MLSGRNTACARCFSRGPVAPLPECSWIPACAGMTGRNPYRAPTSLAPRVSQARGHSRRPRPTCSFPRKRESTGPPNPAMFRPERIPRAGQPTASGSQHPAWIPALECLRRGAFPQAPPHLSFPRKRESTGPSNPAMFRPERIPRVGQPTASGSQHPAWIPARDEEIQR